MTAKIGVCVLICAALLAAYGWISNIVKIVFLLNDPLTALFIARVVGIFFAPLGAVLGYI